MIPIINRNTFVANGEVNEFGGERGTVQVTLCGVTKTVEALRSRVSKDSIYAYGFVGRYRNSDKLWDAMVESFVQAGGKVREVAHFGKEGRVEHGNKLHSIWFKN